MSELALQRAFINTRYGAVHYWTAGSGPPLLLLHQSAQSSEEFLGILGHLCNTYTVISLDLPGHGVSDTPDHELRVDEYCEAVLAVMDAVKTQQLHIVGHHGGCMLAVNIANQHPHRVGKLVLSGGGLPDPAVADQLLNQPMTRDLPMDREGDFLRQAWRVYQKMGAPGVALETIFQPFATGLKARLRPYDMHYEVLRWDYRAAVEVLTHPALLIKAEHDAFSGDVEGLHQLLPGSQMITLPDCGPWLFYERPDACALAIRNYLDHAQ